MRWFRRGLMLASVLILLAALGAMVLLGNLAWFKSDIAQWAQHRLNRQLEIRGGIHVSLIPLRIQAYDVVLADREKRAESFLQVKQVDVIVPWSGLLQGVLRADRVIVHGLEVTLVRDANGRTNIDDLLPLPGSEPVPLDLRNIELDDTTVRLVDEGSRRHAVIRDLSLSLPRLTDREPSTLALRGKWQIDGIQGDVALRGRMLLDRSMRTLTWSTAELDWRGVFSADIAASVQLRGDLAVHWAPLIIQARHLRIDGTVHQRTEARPLSVSVGSRAIDWQGESWRALESVLSIQRASAELTATVAYLHGDREQIAIPAARLSARWSEQSELSMVTPVIWSRDTLTLPSWQASFRFSPAANALSGALVGEASWHRRRLRGTLSCRGQIEGSALDGQLDFTPAENINGQFSIAIRTLRLDDWLRRPEIPSQRVPSSRDAPRPPSRLHLTGTIRAQTLLYGNLTAQGAKLEAVIRDEKLQLAQGVKLQ